VRCDVCVIDLEREISVTAMYSKVELLTFPDKWMMIRVFLFSW
jgi:hypothetical protein